jgi:phosphatidylglycerophosphatase A
MSEHAEAPAAAETATAKMDEPREDAAGSPEPSGSRESSTPRENSAAGEASGASKPKELPKPRWAFLLATVGGLGNIPLAPGTWGSIAGLLLYAVVQVHFAPDNMSQFPLHTATLVERAWWALWTGVPVALIVAIAGTRAATRVADASGKKDPQFVVIDEVSGQHLTYLLALTPANWNYLLLGLILFRAFDIWKPFPARQAERLPGGLGIMADDWFAAIYAAIGLWLVRGAGIGMHLVLHRLR